MRITPISRKVGFINLNTDETFRDETVLLSNNGLILFKSTLMNLWTYYNVVTEQLSTNTHLFDIKALDNLNNESSLIEGSVEIDTYTMPPRFPVYTYIDRHHIKLSWKEPADGNPDNYVIYSNNGSGDIDTTSHFDVVSGTTKTKTYNLEMYRNWKFRIESLKDAVESNTKYELHMITPRENVVPPATFDKDIKNIAATGENVSVGKLKITIVWLYGSWASSFRVYHDDGTGTINYSSYIEFARQNGYVQTFTTSQICFSKEDTLFKFVIRAVSPDGVEEGNTVENSVILDGVAPSEATGLSIGSTF